MSMSEFANRNPRLQKQPSTKADILTIGMTITMMKQGVHF